MFQKFKYEKAKRKNMKDSIKATTKVALEPDSSNIEKGTSYKNLSFPLLNAELFVEPRPVPELLQNHSGGDHKSKNNPLLKWTRQETFADSSTTVFAIWLVSYTATIGKESKEMKDFFLTKFSITLMANGSSSRIIQLIIVSILSVQGIYFFS